MTTCWEDSPRSEPLKRPCAASRAILRESQRMTPLPAARPSALTTMGGWKRAMAPSSSLARGGLGGAEDAQAAGLECVDDAEGERQLGTNDGEGGDFGGNEADHVVEIFEVDGEAAGDLRDAAVAGRADNFRDTRAACDGPGKRVFAAP